MTLKQGLLFLLWCYACIMTIAASGGWYYANQLAAAEHLDEALRLRVECGQLCDEVPGPTRIAVVRYQAKLRHWAGINNTRFKYVPNRLLTTR